MITRSHRFHGYNSLHFVYSHGKSLRSPTVALKYIHNSKRNSFRLAVVVSKKVNKSAVQRNRMRRRIFEIVRRQQAAIHEPYDIVLTVFSDQLIAMPAHELETMIIGLLHQAAIL